MTDLQKRILGIYKEFQRVCNKYSLRYYAEGGTKIGAMSFNGFIPWDDDMDIVMPWPDYNKFIKIAQKELPKHLELFDNLSAKVSDIVCLKIHDATSMFTSYHLLANPDSYTGIFLDIFPLIGTPNESHARNKFLHELSDIYDSLFKKRLYDDGGASASTLRAHYLKLAHAYNFDESDIVVPTQNALIEKFLREDMINCIPKTFEDTTIPIPRNYELQINQQYPSYKKYPKQAKRIKHGDFMVLDPTKSYKTYANDARRNFMLAPFKKISTNEYYLRKQLEGRLRKAQDEASSLRQDIIEITSARSYKLALKIGKITKAARKNTKGA